MLNDHFEILICYARKGNEDKHAVADFGEQSALHCRAAPEGLRADAALVHDCKPSSVLHPQDS